MFRSSRRIVGVSAGLGVSIFTASSGHARTMGTTTEKLDALTARMNKLEGKFSGDQPNYTLHLYDHCPFCLRVELVMGHAGIEYERVVHGYGAGAPEGSPGYDRKGGPRVFTGHKMLPVLMGPNLPNLKEGYTGMPESLQVCAFLQGEHGVSIPCDAGRDDVAAWHKKFKPLQSLLSRPRLIKMPVKDWELPEDVEYAKWKYTTKIGFDYASAEAATPELIKEMNAVLAELVPLLKGKNGDITLNEWGFSMDDVKLLPDLRAISCVAGLTWPPAVEAYLVGNFAKTKAGTYLQDAC